MKFDEYHTVINDQETYKRIAFGLKNHGSFLIAWTDQIGTQFDILFTINPDFEMQNIGMVQRGIRRTDLFVSIMGLKSHGFEIENQNTHQGYLAEKLGVTGDETIEKLGELINGVKKELVK